MFIISFMLHVLFKCRQPAPTSQIFQPFATWWCHRCEFTWHFESVFQKGSYWKLQKKSWAFKRKSWFFNKTGKLLNRKLSWFREFLVGWSWVKLYKDVGWLRRRSCLNGLSGRSLSWLFKDIPKITSDFRKLKRMRISLTLKKYIIPMLIYQYTEPKPVPSSPSSVHHNICRLRWCLWQTALHYKTPKITRQGF